MLERFKKLIIVNPHSKVKFVFSYAAAILFIFSIFFDPLMLAFNFGIFAKYRQLALAIDIFFLIENFIYLLTSFPKKLRANILEKNLVKII